MIFRVHVVCISLLCFDHIFRRLWFRHYKMAQDTLEDYFLNAVEVRGAPAGDLFSEPALYCYSTKRGSHNRLTEGGCMGGWVGRVR